MILCPLQNNSSGTAPIITQALGLRPDFYAQWGFKGHEGIDIRAQTQLPVYSPIEGTVAVIDSGDKAYGLHVNITNDRFKIILAHLSHVGVKSGDFVVLGSPIGLTGDSGSAKGSPHLHMTVMRLKDGIVQDRDNGFGGGIDVSANIITWKGTLTKSTV